METLDIYSFNARGLHQTKTRVAVFRHLQLKHKGVIFLQETHSRPIDESRWQMEWGCKIYFSHGSTNSKDVAILLTKSWDGTINNTLLTVKAGY